MGEGRNLKSHLSKTYCTKCGSSLDSAKLVPVGQFPLAVIAHAFCAVCNSENMVTITSLGTGVMPMMSDLKGSEVQYFMNLSEITPDEILELHKELEKDSLCNLLQKKEKNLEKEQKN